MNSFIISLICIIFCFATMYGQIPEVTSGGIRHFDKFKSKYVRARDIDVWLPDNYNKNQKYNVLYMHDGKALFDSTLMFNHQSWNVDNVLGRLLKDKKIKDVIVVGISNGESLRFFEYTPQKPMEFLTAKQRDSVYNLFRFNDPNLANTKVQSDNYLKFIVEELKPFIDSEFSTLIRKENTFIAGSSMGGLISMYAICEYPSVFGGAACLSTHWPGLFTLEHNPLPAAFMNYLENNLPNPVNHKIYFDHGTINLDALYGDLQKQADEIMKKKGYTDKNWLTKVFEVKDHNELSWNQRFDVPIVFLLGTNP